MKGVNTDSIQYHAGLAEEYSYQDNGLYPYNTPVFSFIEVINITYSDTKCFTKVSFLTKSYRPVNEYVFQVTNGKTKLLNFLAECKVKSKKIKNNKNQKIEDNQKEEDCDE